MISPANIPENPISDTNQNSGGGRQIWYLKPQEENLKCPRCDSHNTKFCYYNNYSLTQPRYFCKTCRRYWTKGGTLRNIPIGGSCRKTKKTKSNSTISIDSKESSETNNGLKFSNGFSQSIEFQLGGSGGGCFNQFVSNNPSCFDIGSSMNYCSLMGVGFNGGIEDMGSIESLNYVRPERLGLVFGGENQERSVIVEDQTQKTPPILFQNMEMSKPEAYVVSNPRESNVVSGNITEWLFESSSNWSGMQACIDLHQYSSLP